MSTPTNPKFSISAEYIGPIFHLNGQLTKNAQNLVFARNGTGKSFLSRAFRCLDIFSQGASLDGAPLNLVSDESPDGKGAFSFGRDTNVMGSLQFDRILNKTAAQVNNTIFHVFSEDFIQDELREQEYNLNGEIENQITVDSKNIQVKDAKKALEIASVAESRSYDNLKSDFEKAKFMQLAEKAGVRSQLKEYAALKLDEVLNKFQEIPQVPLYDFATILKDLDALKSIPAEPLYPETITTIDFEAIDLDEISHSLRRITSPSSVSESLKIKIEKHRDFYKTGVEIIDDKHLSSCPFCEQSITASAPKAIIDAFVEYFSNEEAKHKSELRGFYGALNNKEKQLYETEAKLTQQTSRYDALKLYLPSMKSASLVDSDKALKLAINTIASLKVAIESKAKNLGVEASLPNDDLALRISTINEVIEGNNSSVAALTRAISKSDDERKKSQRQACSVFELEFAVSRWPEIESHRKHQSDTKEKVLTLSTLEKSSPSTDARVRVADTFELLLREFFADRYCFDKNSFVLKRGTHEMTRGPHRTLSDGEKTVIAFCYFVACIHRKVKANSDYHRLFLVFDDPVTSMSYDFVFGIAQTFKNLNISNQGRVSLNPGLINGNSHRKPDLLILTHSSYFYNILVANKVVETDAAFGLQSGKSIHKFAQLNKYLAPFQEQLKDIYDVANGRDPDHSTANAIRSVLEAVGRFCRPDKSSSLSLFVQHLAVVDGITVKSVLINSLSHGTYYDEMPSPDDLKLASSETLKVVEKYAAGQIEVVKGIAARV